jgi:predicted transcriptional regulator
MAGSSNFSRGISRQLFSLADASLQDIARKLEFIAAVRQGFSELDQGQSVSIEKVEHELPSWIIK